LSVIFRIIRKKPEFLTYVQVKSRNINIYEFLGLNKFRQNSLNIGENREIGKKRTKIESEDYVIYDFKHFQFGFSTARYMTCTYKKKLKMRRFFHFFSYFGFFLNRMI
jgi:hypothetical protein